MSAYVLRALKRVYTMSCLYAILTLLLNSDTSFVVSFGRKERMK